MQPPAYAQGWFTGDTGPGGAVGKFAPQPRVARGNGLQGLLDQVIGNGFVLLGDNLDPASLLTPDQRAGWDKLGATYRAVRSVDQAGETADDIIDITGSLIPWMRGYGAKVIALRPDRFVAAADRSGLGVPVVP